MQFGFRTIRKNTISDSTAKKTKLTVEQEKLENQPPCELF